MRVTCSRYSDLDDIVIAKATSFNLPIIGGTALEIWANHFGVSGVRKRSDNDLDFISNDLSVTDLFQRWVQKNIPIEKVQVDILQVRSHDYSKYITYVDGVCIMKLEYLLWSKLVRGTAKDLQDIKWVLSIPQLTDEDLSFALEDLGVTDQEIEILNGLL